jgi:asparagine synthase (glutamine-hydrolysing)
MCGIAGILHLGGEPVDSAALETMRAAVRHRGPDGDGLWIEGPIGVAHQRLAVIDLSPQAGQPMHSHDGRLVVVYNGEVFNYRELRAELESLGSSFGTHGDTEVVVEALSTWGEAAVERLNGMFALAAWDRQERRLLMARDRYGVKPLYWSLVANRLLFGSEAKAILAYPGFPAELNPEALIEYMTFQNYFTDRTLFRRVRMLEPGTVMTMTVNGGPSEPKVSRYWDFAFEEPQSPSTDDEYLEELDRLFRQAIERQLVSDVEVGAYLSGGMDSSAVTAVAAGHLPWIRTFTCGFDLHSATGLELGFDEREAAEHLSYLLRTEHYEMVLKSGDMERVMPRLVRHLEEPRVGQSYPNFYVAQLASKFVTVVLAGTGGDELFGGYPWRYYRAVVNHDFEDYIDKYYLYWHRLVPNSVLRELLAPVWSEAGHVWTRDIFRDVFDHHADRLTRPEDYVNHSLYLEAKTFLHGLLVVEDKLSMAHGLETRVPFLDNDLVDFAMRLPVRLKLGNLGDVVRLNENEPGPKTRRYFERTRDGKLLLRAAMSRYVPDDVTARVKQGFSAPDASWFKGDSLDWVRRVVSDDDARIYEFLDRGTVRRLVDEHLQGRTNRRLLIWSLLYLEQFCAEYLGRGS